MKCITATSIDMDALSKIIAALLSFCHDVTDMMTKLLAGVWVPHTESERKFEDNLSPSFADIDVALDFALKDCPSYNCMVELVGHLHCRELLLSFCWLNLKAISFIIGELGQLCRTFKTKCLILEESRMAIVEEFFLVTLIKCRHKGVIENSLVALTKFCRLVASIPSLWKEIASWCQNALKTSISLTVHSSVTKRRFF